MNFGFFFCRSICPRTCACEWVKLKRAKKCAAVKRKAADPIQCNSLASGSWPNVTQQVCFWHKIRAIFQFASCVRGSGLRPSNTLPQLLQHSHADQPYGPRAHACTHGNVSLCCTESGQCTTLLLHWCTGQFGLFTACACALCCWRAYVPSQSRFRVFFGVFFLCLVPCVIAIVRAHRQTWKRDDGHLTRRKSEKMPENERMDGFSVENSGKRWIFPDKKISEIVNIRQSWVFKRKKISFYQEIIHFHWNMFRYTFTCSDFRRKSAHPFHLASDGNLCKSHSIETQFHCNRTISAHCAVDAPFFLHSKRLLTWKLISAAVREFSSMFCSKCRRLLSAFARASRAPSCKRQSAEKRRFSLGNHDYTNSMHVMTCSADLSYIISIQEASELTEQETQEKKMKKSETKTAAEQVKWEKSHRKSTRMPWARENGQTRQKSVFLEDTRICSYSCTQYVHTTLCVCSREKSKYLLVFGGFFIFFHLRLLRILFGPHLLMLAAAAALDLLWNNLYWRWNASTKSPAAHIMAEGYVCLSLMSAVEGILC